MQNKECIFPQLCIPDRSVIDVQSGVLLTVVKNELCVDTPCTRLLLVHLDLRVCST